MPLDVQRLREAGSNTLRIAIDKNQWGGVPTYRIWCIVCGEQRRVEIQMMNADLSTEWLEVPVFCTKCEVFYFLSKGVDNSDESKGD